MSTQEIKHRYQTVVVYSKWITFFAMLTWLPRLTIAYTGQHSLFGINELAWFYVAILGLFVYIIYYLFYWKCPSCLKFPGGGWKRTNCKFCGVDLR